MKNLSLLLFMLLISGITIVNGQKIVYVSPGGSGNQSGSDWDNATTNIFSAANTSTSETEIIIYVKEGTYTGTRGTVTDNSNMPDGKNVTIIGGYDTSLTGTDLCGPDGTTYNPSANQVIIETDGTNDTRTWFWMNNNDGNLTVRGVTFNNPDNLNAGQGTVLYVAGGSNIYTFEDVFITNSDGDIGRGPFFIGLGAQNATLNLTRVAVENASASALNEGDVVLNFGANTGNCVVNVADCYFSNIIESGFVCAGLYLRGSVGGHVANITGTTFCNLKATGGAAIRVDGSHTANITDCDFIGGLTNVSGQDGAAIALANQATATVSNSVFYNNKAEGDAGAINVGTGSTLTSTGNHYENNQGAAAGAIKINASTFTSTNDVFKENFCWGSFGGGGAIKIEGNENGGNGTIDANVTGATFCSNYAQNGDGGAIDFVNIARSVIVEKSDFKNNNSRGGGAIKMIGSDVEVIDCNFEGNQTGSINSSGSITDISGEGGAIYVSNCAIKLSGSSFKANRSDRGGAISIDDNDGSPIFPTYREIIENSVFWENVAEQQGGGAIHSIRVTGGFSLTGSTFTNNEALRSNGANGGGAIRVDGVCCIVTDVYNNFDNNSFTGNICNGSTTRATGSGGSDIKTFYGRVLGISNSKMQLGSQGNYSGDFTFSSGNTFGNTDQGTAATTIEDCTANQPTCVAPTAPLPATNDNCTDSDGDGISDSAEGKASNKDTDGDGVPDYKDLDSDNDGIPDAVEVGSNPKNPVDTDGDGVPDYLDLDSDNDGINDIVEAGGTDTDGNGIVDDLTDADQDGFADVVDNLDLPTPVAGTTPVNTGTPLNYNKDTDGVAGPDRLTVPAGVTPATGTDTDGDGIPDSIDGDPNNFGDAIDTDGDGIPDSTDLDDDNDGIPDTVENNPPGCVAADLKAPATCEDVDGDGIPNRLDLDSDNDGINDTTEGGVSDPDGDGIAGTGTPTVNSSGQVLEGGNPVNVTAPSNTDGTGMANPYDLDSDGDGISDVAESGNGALDADNDGMIDTVTDVDKDGIPDNVDGDTTKFGDDPEATPTDLPKDSDGDGVPDYKDLDSDNDGIPDSVEMGCTPAAPATFCTPVDTDGDGTPDYLDLDSDGDGINDVVEAGGSDPDGDGIPGTGTPTVDVNGQVQDGGSKVEITTPKDTDGDGVPDHRDLDSDNDGIPDSVEKGCTPVNPATTCKPVDTDGDGVSDFQDLDSDNDGILDVTEAGIADPDGDGQAGTSTNGVPPVNANGQPLDGTTVIENKTPGTDYTTPAGGTPLTGADTDGDGIIDSVDGNVSTTQGTSSFGSAPILDYGDNSAFGMLSVSGSGGLTNNVPTASTAVWAGAGVSHEGATMGNAMGDSDTFDDGLVIKTPAPATGTGRTSTWTVTANSNTATTVHYSLRIDWNADGTIDNTYIGTINTASPVSQDVTVPVPDGYSTSNVNVRLVVAPTEAEAAKTNGVISNGEIEDYLYSSQQVLPVELISFSGEIVGNDAALTWSTASEINNDFFEVQRSLDGRSFVSIGKIDGSGNSSQTQSYRYVDKNAGANSRKVYYRLKQVDFDGKYNFSNLIFMNFKAQKGDYIFPSPAIDVLHINTVGYEGSILVEIFDLNGRKVVEKVTNERRIMLDMIPAGIYTLKVSDTYNNSIFIERLNVVTSR